MALPVIPQVDDLTNKETMFLHALSKILHDSPSLAQAFSPILQKISEYQGYQLATLWMIDTPNPTLQLVESWASPVAPSETVEILETIRTVRIGNGLPGLVWKHQDTIRIQDLNNDHHMSPREFQVQQNGLPFAIGCPITHQGKFLGVLELFSTEPHTPRTNIDYPLETALLQLGLILCGHIEQEDALRATNHSTYLTDHLPVIWFKCQIDDHFSILEIRGQCEQLSGRTKEEVGSHTVGLLDLCHPADIELVRYQLSQAIQSPHMKLRPFRIQHPNSTIKWVTLCIQETGIDHAIPFIAGMLIDHTESKHLEDARRRINQLESVGLLASGIAHDFNNMLTSIVANVILAKLVVSPADRSFVRLSDAEQACMRARDLTQQLLHVAKGQAPVQRTCSIRQLVTDSALLAVAGTNVQPQFVMANDLWPVDINETQLYQVINNLVVNARQAMPKGGCTTIRADNVCIDQNSPPTQTPLPPGRYVKISVSDPGIGIHPHHLKKIFDPYFTTKQKGHGLGLATIHSIIQNHGGAIHVESEPGMGATFHIYLVASRTKPVTMSTQEEAVPRKNTGRILILDDEVHIRELAAEMLIQLGYEVETAGDGLEVLDRYKSAQTAHRPFDTVILGLTMPGGLGGEYILQHLRRLDPQVKAIASSGYSDHPVMGNFEAFGFVSAFAKPFNLHELSKAVSQTFQQQTLPPNSQTL